MTLIDLRLEYLKDTGKYVPMMQDTQILGTASYEEYTTWLENKVLLLSQPVIIHGEPYRLIKHNDDELRG